MKKFLLICTAVAATACCCGKQAKVSAIVAGPDKVAAVVVEYAEALDAESVCPEAFVVEGREVVCAKLVEPTKVIVALKKECCCGGEKPECGEKKECCKEKAECGEAKPECCEEKKAECGEKHECEGEKKECCKEKKAECCDIPVPDVAVKQVVDIKTAEGKVVKAWKKAVKATEAVPAPPCHKKPCCGEKPECDEKPACCEKAE